MTRVNIVEWRREVANFGFRPLTTPSFNADGQVYKIVKFATDVTEQVKAARIEEVVRSTLAAVEAAKAHDLTQRVATDSAFGDVKLLASGVNDLLDTLANIINAVSEAAESSLAASGEIATGSHDLAQRLVNRRCVGGVGRHHRTVWPACLGEQASNSLSAGPV